MHVAKEVLASTDSSVERVARLVGYASVEAFSRAFKRSLGASPRAWREGDPSSGRQAASV